MFVALPPLLILCSWELLRVGANTPGAVVLEGMNGCATKRRVPPRHIQYYLLGVGEFWDDLLKKT